MSIDNTQHLSKLSKEEIKTVYKKWPNPLTPLAFMIGGLATLGFGIQSANKGPEGMGALIGSVVVFIALVLGSSIYGLVKYSKARKALNLLAEKHSLPQTPLLKEFKKNLKHMRSL